MWAVPSVGAGPIESKPNPKTQVQINEPGARPLLDTLAGSARSKSPADFPESLTNTFKKDTVLVDFADLRSTL
jgi:hypothetical protein